MRSTWNIFVLVVYTTLSLNASVQGLVHGLALRPMLQRASMRMDYGAGYNAHHRPALGIYPDTTPLAMRMDYGAGYNPRHRPALGIYPDTLPLGQRPQIDYGSGYDPRNRPVTQSEYGGHDAATESLYSPLPNSLPETSALCQGVLVLKICLDLSRGDTVESTKPVDYSMSLYEPTRRSA